MRHGFFGEGGPLRVAHDAASAGVVTANFASGEFASGGERRLGSAGVSAARGEQIGKVQAARFDFHQKLLGRGMRVGDLLQFEDFGTAETSDDECFHAESLTAPGAVRGVGFCIYNDDRVSDPRGLRDSLAAGARVAPVSPARSEGADGNVCASRVGKETLAGITACLVFPFPNTVSAFSIQPLARRGFETAASLKLNALMLSNC